MRLNVSYQLYQLASSLLLGIAAGVLYDLLRILRRRLNASALFDFLFWLVMLFALFTLGMDAGEGSLHVFMLIFSVLGFALYMLTLSKSVLAFLTKIADFIGFALSPAKKLAKKILQAVRIFVSKIKARLKMVKKAKRKKGRDADEKVSGNTGDNSGSTHRVCYSEPCRSAKGADKGTEYERRAQPEGHRRGRGKAKIAEKDKKLLKR